MEEQAGPFDALNVSDLLLENHIDFLEINDHVFCYLAKNFRFYIYRNVMAKISRINELGNLQSLDFFIDRSFATFIGHVRFQLGFSPDESKSFLNAFSMLCEVLVMKKKGGSLSSLKRFIEERTDSYCKFVIPYLLIFRIYDSGKLEISEFYGWYGVKICPRSLIICRSQVCSQVQFGRYTRQYQEFAKVVGQEVKFWISYVNIIT